MQGTLPAMSVPATLYDQLRKLFHKAESGGHVQVYYEVMKLLALNKLSWKTKILPMFVHCHPENRDGVGCYPTEVHSLLDDILEAGWNDCECRPVCVEVRSSDVACMAFNKKLQEDSSDLLAPVEAGTVKYASLSCTHTNQVLRLLHYRCQHTNPDVCIDGRLSMEKLQVKDEAFFNAVQEGLTWTVISEAVLVSFPQMAELIQQAENTGSQMQRQETELQLVRRVFNLIKGRDHVNFDLVKTQILRTKPSCSSSLPAIFRFMMNFCTHGGQWLIDLETTVRGSPTRTLGPEKWEALGQVLKRSDFLHLRHVCLQFAYVAPEGYLSVTDLKKFWSMANVSVLEEVESWMVQVRALLAVGSHHKKLPLSCQEQMLYEQELVAIAMKKEKKDWKESTAIFFQQLRDKYGLTMQTEFDQYLPQVSMSAAQTAIPEGAVVKQFQEDGRLANVEAYLAAKGFAKGAQIIRKTDKSMFSIEAIEDQYVVLKSTEGKQGSRATKKIHYKAFEHGEFSTFTPKESVELTTNVLAFDPMCINQPKICCLKALIFLQLVKEWQQHTKTLDRLVLTTKPKGVKVGEKKIAKEKLVLIPFTMNIYVKSKETPMGAAHVGLGEALKDFNFGLSSMFQSKDNQSLVPFWYVYVTHSQDEANMEIVSEHKMKFVNGPVENTQVIIPKMRNTRELAPEEDLVVYRPKAVIRKKDDFETPMVPAKRLKGKQ